MTVKTTTALAAVLVRATSSSSFSNTLQTTDFPAVNLLELLRHRSDPAFLCALFLGADLLRAGRLASLQFLGQELQRGLASLLGAVLVAAFPLPKPASSAYAPPSLSSSPHSLELLVPLVAALCL